MSKNINFVGKIKASFSGRKFRSGAYASILSIVVIVMILVVNLIISKMEVEIDLTADSKFSVTEDTKDVIKELKDDITIYYIVQQGDEIQEFEKIAQQYDRLSDKIELVYKDPVLYPTFGTDLVEDEITQNSFIVVNNTNNKAKYVDYQEMLIQEFDYQYFQYKTTGTDAEGKLTSAILYVTSENLPNLYMVEGHQESATPETFSLALDKMNVNLQTISTLTAEKIPDDCDVLYINTPKTDFEEREVQIIKDYLAAGGNIVLIVDYNSTNLKNLQSIIESYGIHVVEGRVLESDANLMMPNYPGRLLPKVANHDITTKVYGSSLRVFMPNSSGLQILDNKRSTLTLTPLLSTSEKAYSKTNLQSATLNKEDGDIDGPFYLGILSSDNFKGVVSNLIVYSSEYTFSYDNAGLANNDLLTGTIRYLVGDSMTTVSIPVKNYGESYIYISATHSIIWGVTTAIVLPLIIFIIGSFICLRRRKK